MTNRLLRVLIHLALFRAVLLGLRRLGVLRSLDELYLWQSVGIAVAFGLYDTLRDLTYDVFPDDDEEGGLYCDDDACEICGVEDDEDEA